MTGIGICDRIITLQRRYPLQHKDAFVISQRLMSGALAALFIYNKVCFLRPNFISLVVQIVLTNTTLICVGIYATYSKHNFRGHAQFHLTRKCFEFRQFWIQGDIQTICKGMTFQSLNLERYSENNHTERFNSDEDIGEIFYLLIIMVQNV